MSYCGTKPNYIFSVKWRRLILLSILSCACIVIVVFTLPLAEDLNIRRYIVWNGNTDTSHKTKADDQITRLRRIKKHCLEHPVLQLSNVQNGSHFPDKDCPDVGRKNSTERCLLKDCPLFLVKQRGVVFCLVPKAGSRSIRDDIVKIANMTQSRGYLDFGLSSLATTCLDRFGLDYMSPVEMEELVKVIFVRHPFNRLVSAFTDKMSNKKYTYNWLYNVLQEKRMLRDNLNDTGFTFKEFVTGVISSPPESYGIHWIPMSRLCDPCRVKYDFIGKLETFGEDVSDLEEHIKLNSSVTHSTTGKGQQKLLFEQLNYKDINSLWWIYRNDFEMFGYTIDEFFKKYDVTLK